MAYIHKIGAFRKLVLQAPWMEQAMVAGAEAVKARAEALAAEHTVTTSYERSFEVKSGRTVGSSKHNRAYARVVNTDPQAFTIEKGHQAPNGRHVAGLHILTRALDVGE